jgi:hypothetical protein
MGLPSFPCSRLSREPPCSGSPKKNRGSYIGTGPNMICQSFFSNHWSVPSDSISKRTAWRRFYSIRSIPSAWACRRAGAIVLWIANLAVGGALNYRWGKELEMEGAGFR